MGPVGSGKETPKYQSNSQRDRGTRPASPLLPLSSPVQIVLPSDPKGRICQTKQQESDPNGNTLHFLEGRVSLCYTSLSSSLGGPWQWPLYLPTLGTAARPQWEEVMPVDGSPGTLTSSHT